jgi:hypothetical protein
MFLYSDSFAARTLSWSKTQAGRKLPTAARMLAAKCGASGGLPASANSVAAFSISAHLQIRCLAVCVLL